MTLGIQIDIFARRRYKQLKDKGITANVAHLAAEIKERDGRDRQCSSPPPVPADGALHIDSTHMPIEAVVETVLITLRKALI